jgi:hypothetical protein
MFDAQDIHLCTRNTPACATGHIPPGKKMTQQTKVIPMTASQCSLYEFTTFFITRKMTASTASPINVPAPPRRV